MRLTKSRPYRMHRRAELVDQTRQRITEAAARLHTTIGPANTSIAAIAEEAGVTRVTVYRHFADLDALFEACTAHWQAENPTPDASRWPLTGDLDLRARQALLALYAWYRDHAAELFPLFRDLTAMPRSTQDLMCDQRGQLGDLLVQGHAQDDDAGRQMRAVARHLVGYPTWRSLAIEQDLSDAEAAEIGVRMLTGMAASALAPGTR